jgi:molybdopterin molybdotransferase
MATVSFTAARDIVLREVRSARRQPAIEVVPLAAAAGRVLAEPIQADRDLPAVARSLRDGFAVHAADLPGELDVIGEVRAGERFTGTVHAGQALEIMTGAPLPDGADAVVMIEKVTRLGQRVSIDRPATPGQAVAAAASQAVRSETVLHAGQRLDFAGIAMLATFGHHSVSVYRRPTVAILPTGDEIVAVGQVPNDYQVRNSNAASLAVQVAQAGGKPRILDVARDNLDGTFQQIERALESDLVLLSGGVSAGKYDVVEPVLAGMGAEFFFDRVLIQPGKPLVFGHVRGRFFFGLPGNPASTMVTFAVFARAALELLGGDEDPALHMPYAHLTCDFHHKAGLTRILPARLTADGASVTPLAWHGSGDVPALTRANCWMIADPGRAEYSRDEPIRVLLR